MSATFKVVRSVIVQIHGTNLILKNQFNLESNLDYIAMSTDKLAGSLGAKGCSIIKIKINKEALQILCQLCLIKLIMPTRLTNIG